ncbi:MAG: hypothetical protein QM775_09150 [Pirellulales bacterium]
MIRIPGLGAALARWLSIACCLAAPVIAQEASKEPAAKEPAAKAEAPAQEAAPSVELRLPTTPKPTATPVPIEEPTPTDELGQLLYNVGVRPSSLAKFTDGGPLSEAERRALVGIFAGVRQLKPDDWSTLAKPLPAAPQKLEAAARGKLWNVPGTLKEIEPLDFTDAELELVYPAAVANAADFKLPADDLRRKFYRCKLAIDGRAEPATVYSLAVPDELRTRKTLDERSGVQGLLLKTTSADGAPLLATPHVAWYKRTPLGDLGMDYALYDGLPERSEKLAEPRECLFNLLGAMKKIDFAKLQELTKDPYSVVPLFNSPKTMRGELAAYDGQVRRAVPIVPGDELHRRFGVSRYYEVALFTPGADDNPLLFNLLELPEGFPTGEDVNERVRIPGTYVVTWTYQRDATEGEKKKGSGARIQFAPLLVGKTLQWTPASATAQQAGFNWWINGAVIVLVLVVIAVGWSTLRADRKARQIMQRTNAPAQGTSLNDLPYDYSSKPDFSKLEEQDGAK